MNNKSMPKGRLLLAPKRIIKVHTSDNKHTLSPKDFHIEGCTVTYIGKADIPKFSEDEIFPATRTERSIDRHTDGKRYLLFSEGRYFYDQQVRFDYESDATWPDYSPVTSSRAQTAVSLSPDQQMTVVALGDSITAGANAIETPPYINQFCDFLRSHLGGGVALHNLAKGGMSTPWGVEQAPAAAALNPDLFVLAFGMNDASDNCSARDFLKNIRRILETVQHSNPNARCLVVSGMNGNINWNASKPDLHLAYHEALKSLQSPSVIFVDVMTAWDQLVAHKGFLSVTGNGVNHPNDFGHRLYAQQLLRAMLGSAPAFFSSFPKTKTTV